MSVAVTALKARNAGISTLAVRADGSKAPFGEWEELQRRLRTEEEIDLHYDQPELGLGFICGSISGNLECLDFDDAAAYRDWVFACKNAGLADLQRMVCEGYHEETPNGHHVFYRVRADGEPADGNRKLAKRKGSNKAFIETRGEGGYAIVAPSQGPVHESGRPYVRMSGSIDSIAVISRDEREMLIDVARSLDHIPETIVRKPTPSTRIDDDSLKPGDDFNARASWFDVLEPHGWAAVCQLASGETQWRRPGKTVGISATTGHDGSEYMYVFSTSTPIEAGRGFSKYSIYAQLNHGGDFAAASAELRRQGFGGKRAELSVDLSKLKEKIKNLSTASQGEDDGDWKTIFEIGGLDWLDQEPPPREWLFKRGDDGAIPLGEVGMLVAPGGRGKTMALLQMAASVSAGIDWFGTFQCQKPGRVAVVLGEEGLLEVRRRLHKAINALDLTPEQRELIAKNLVPIGSRGKVVNLVKIDKAGGLELTDYHTSMLAQLSRHEYSAIIIDPLSRFAPGTESDNQNATAAIQAFEILTQVPGTPTLLVAHHSGKTSRTEGNKASSSAARGVTGLTDAVRWVANLTGTGDADLGLEVSKSNYAPCGLPVPLVRGPGGSLRRASEEEVASMQVEVAVGPERTHMDIEQALEAAIYAAPRSTKNYLETVVTGHRKSTITDVLNRMVESGKVTILKGRRGSHLHVLSDVSLRTDLPPGPGEV